MIGKLFITSKGYDPERGKHVKDPYLGKNPSLGACRPDIRKVVNPGDYLFFVTGRVNGFKQYVMGSFQVAQKIDAMTAYQRFPGQRLHLLPDGQLNGNVVVDLAGRKHPLDSHKATSFAQRIPNYVVGKNPIAIVTPEEVDRARAETLGVLRRVLGRDGATPFQVIGRWGTTLTQSQVEALLEWLHSFKVLRMTG